MRDTIASLNEFARDAEICEVRKANRGGQLMTLRIAQPS